MGQAANHHEQQTTDGTGACRLNDVRAEAFGAGRSRPEFCCSSPASLREALMTARSFVALVIAVIGIQITAEAGDNNIALAVDSRPGAATIATASATTVAAAFDTPQTIDPWIHPSMPSNMQDKLRTAFETAVARVQEVPECGGLFAKLGADPVESLSRPLYFPAGPYKETTRCSRAAAFTYVGDRPTKLCRRFETLSDDWAAVIVVHEALHGAGLTERPSDPKAMSSGAINKMVRKACGL
jgi:hypothetical protein